MRAQRKPSRFRIDVNTSPRRFCRWLTRGGVPLGKDHKPIDLAKAAMAHDWSRRPGAAKG